ncbi:MAG: SPASM domain-containing protein [Bacteroidales bacterium]|nr:SPASM domain-containing protein [Bacteroidales bacterium]
MVVRNRSPRQAGKGRIDVHDGSDVSRNAAAGNAVIEHNGELYACDHYVYPRYRLGNVLESPLNELMDLPRTAQFALRKYASLPKKCIRCPYLPACNGECPQHRDPVTGVNALCEGYRLFFDYAAPVLDRMHALLSQGSAPAEVMAFQRET